MARDVTGSNIGLSFIDVLASALGAAVLLFVILASTPPDVPSRAHAIGSFIRYEWTVHGDPKALLRLKLYFPDSGGRPYWTDLDDLSGVAVKCDVPRTTSILIAGFSPDSGESGATPGDRTYVVRLNGPAPGNWRVGVEYYGRAGGIVSKPPPIRIRASPILADGKVPDNMQQEIDPNGSLTPKPDNEPMTLQYAGELLSPTVEETVKPPKANCP
jgi:hypothetical protein